MRQRQCFALENSAFREDQCGGLPVAGPHHEASGPIGGETADELAAYLRERSETPACTTAFLPPALCTTAVGISC